MIDKALGLSNRWVVLAPDEVRSVRRLCPVLCKCYGGAVRAWHQRCEPPTGFRRTIKGMSQNDKLHCLVTLKMTSSSAGVQNGRLPMLDTKRRKLLSFPKTSLVHGSQCQYPEPFVRLARANFSR
jgi:hypothetical protein